MQMNGADRYHRHLGGGTRRLRRVRLDEKLTGDLLPPTDHVGKHCQPKELIQDEQADGSLVAVGVRGAAFFPDEDGVSVAWVEHPHHPKDGVAAIQAMINCMKIRTVRKSHRLACYKIQNIQDCGAKFSKNISVMHDPQSNYDCHALIKGIDPNAVDLLDLIAAECVSIEAMLV